MRRGGGYTPQSLRRFQKTGGLLQRLPLLAAGVCLCQPGRAFPGLCRPLPLRGSGSAQVRLGMAGAGVPNFGGQGGLEVHSTTVPGEKGADQVWYSIQPQGRPGPTVVFFGGDSCIDIAQQSQGTSTILRLSDPEEVVRLLSSRFGAREVVFVGPTRIDGRIWACFDNFVEGTKSGEPARGYRRDGKAGGRLDTVLDAVRSAAHSAFHGAQEANSAPSNGPGAVDGTDGVVGVAASESGGEGQGGRERGTVLVGFSKGGVVVNQLLAEMARPGGGGGGVLGGVTDAHYCDVGLNCRGAYLLEPLILEDLARNHPGLRIHLHGTPRQWGQQRPWIKQEKDRMVKLLHEKGIPHGERLYMAQEAPSLAMHFRVLDEFAPDLCP